MTRVPCAAGLLLVLLSCKGKDDPSSTTAPTSADPVAASVAAALAARAAPSAVAAPVESAAAAPSAALAPSAAPAAGAGPFQPDAKRYAWLGDEGAPTADASLEARFATPPGYVRVKVEPGSFAEWLRGLPMAPEGTPAKSFDDKETLAADNDYLAGVVAIDTGDADLQQSTDVIIRLHAEYLWSRGERDKISYLSATKLNMPLSRWEKGQRLLPNGPNVGWVKKGKPAEVDHPEFRKYLATVFNWANSTSLMQRSTPVADPKELVAGDFFLQSQSPGHVAVVLDIAEKPSGERVALLGQARSPAESIHVVRPGKATAWFSVRPPVPVLTPHSKALAWEDLRRIAPAEPEK
ncbi:MAG TPA: DUF4846 domain-containing protein [Polyangiaceae bacterium]|nr:DUF4846 domain-containing protein [Polyangiaceae bacterium]